MRLEGIITEQDGRPLTLFRDDVRQLIASHSRRAEAIGYVFDELYPSLAPLHHQYTGPLVHDYFLQRKAEHERLRNESDPVIEVDALMDALDYAVSLPYVLAPQN